MITYNLATLGGKTIPLSSPWVIIITPMLLVVNPQLVYQQNCFSFFLSKYWILNIFEKFYPKLWDVPPWIPLPVPQIKASTVVEKWEPANFSFSDLI